MNTYNMKKLLRRGLSLAALGAILSAAHAEVLVKYDLGSTLGTDKFADPSTNANPAAIDLTSITGNNLTLFQYFSGQLQTRPGTASANWDVNAALSSGSYFTFTITANEGYDLTLDTLTFKANAGANRGFYVFSSAGGWAADKVLFSTHSYPGGTMVTTGYADYSVSLTGITVAAGESITFRIYVQATATSSNFYFDDITVNGTIVPASNIPEPSTVALLTGMSVILMGVISRRFAFTKRR